MVRSLILVVRVLHNGIDVSELDMIGLWYVHASLKGFGMKEWNFSYSIDFVVQIEFKCLCKFSSGVF